MKWFHLRGRGAPSPSSATEEGATLTAPASSNERSGDAKNLYPERTGGAPAPYRICQRNYCRFREAREVAFALFETGAVEIDSFLSLASPPGHGAGPHFDDPNVARDAARALWPTRAANADGWLRPQRAQGWWSSRRSERSPLVRGPRSLTLFADGFPAALRHLQIFSSVGMPCNGSGSTCRSG